VTLHPAAGGPVLGDKYGMLAASESWIDKTVIFQGREGARAFGVGILAEKAVELEAVQVRAIDPQAAAAVLDEQAAGLPPIACQPPADRWARLPRTRRALQDGSPCRVVMLGDSIVNDTFNSNYGALLARRYPGSNLRIVLSVRGSTGCWYYREDEAYASYVRQRQPDLLIIGGISHREDADAIRAVIRKTRGSLPACEILLWTGPVGADWRQGPTDGVTPMPVQACAQSPFVRQLEELARAEGVAFFDMKTPWDLYLGASGKPQRWFHRDSVHANDQGGSVLGQLVERFFYAMSSPSAAE
jgi:hypothetical protein